MLAYFNHGWLTGSQGERLVFSLLLWALLVSRELRNGLSDHDSFSELQVHLESIPADLEAYFKYVLEYFIQIGLPISARPRVCRCRSLPETRGHVRGRLLVPTNLEDSDTNHTSTCSLEGTQQRKTSNPCRTRLSRRGHTGSRLVRKREPLYPAPRCGCGGGGCVDFA